MLADAGRGLLARTLAPIAARLPNVNPNHLTVLGVAVACAAGYSFYLTDRHPIFFLVAAGLGVLFGFLDALDGAIARAHGKESAWGDFLDHSCDRLSALVALAGLALSQHVSRTLVLLLMLGTLWHGYLGTQMQASFGRRFYRGVGIAEAILFAIVYSLTAYVIHAAGWPFYFTVREPFGGAELRLSVSDAFAVMALPLVVIGTVQRFLLGRALAREQEAQRPRAGAALDHASAS
ncbi:MAG TPA: CDP-alcohol phosphatidyltransferase family protein [Planctomycetota bacterium]|nr:CDP-alcohol phosphatidyltransferase family protein [Planctomycetota bacterium]